MLVEDKIKNKKSNTTDNRICFEGAEALSEALKTNTTLQSLDLRCEQEENEGDG